MSSSATTSGLTPACRGFEYAEMNIRHTGNAERTLNLVRRAIRMGYDAVVVNTDIGDPYPAELPESAQLDEQPKKKKRKFAEITCVEKEIPDPFIVDERQLPLDALQRAGKRFRQYSRLTVSLNEPSSIHNFLHNAQLRKYDLLAIRPGSEAILNTLTRKTDFYDIVTFDHNADKVPWLGKSKLLEQVRAEGVGFELTYADALKESQQRRQILAHGRSLLKSTRGGRGVVFASAATELLDMRAPCDAMNMLLLWGVAARDARPMISSNARQILLRAEAKRTVKGTLAVSAADGEKIPCSSLSGKASLERLLNVPEFRAQIEAVPRKDKMDTDTA